MADVCACVCVFVFSCVSVCASPRTMVVRAHTSTPPPAPMPRHQAARRSLWRRTRANAGPQSYICEMDTEASRFQERQRRGALVVGVCSWPERAGSAARPRAGPVIHRALPCVRCRPRGPRCTWHAPPQEPRSHCTSRRSMGAHDAIGKGGWLCTPHAVCLVILETAGCDRHSRRH